MMLSPCVILSPPHFKQCVRHGVSRRGCLSLYCRNKDLVMLLIRRRIGYCFNKDWVYNGTYCFNKDVVLLS